MHSPIVGRAHREKSKVKFCGIFAAKAWHSSALDSFGRPRNEGLIPPRYSGNIKSFAWEKQLKLQNRPADPICSPA
jgi:hypothetical protein